MKIKPNIKWLYWFSAFAVLLVAIQIGINYWVKQTLPAIIKEKNDTAYSFDYKDLGFSILKNGVWVKGIEIAPREFEGKKAPFDFTANVGEISVNGVNFIKLLKNKEISAYSISIKEPEVTYYEPVEKRQSEIKSTPKLSNTIHVGNFNIHKGRFKMYEHNRKIQKAEIAGLNIELKGVDLTQNTIEKKIPFTLNTFEVGTKEVFYQLNPAQSLTSDQFKINNNSFVLKGFKIETHSQLNLDSVDYAVVPEVEAPTVRFTGMDYGYDKEDNYYFNAKSLSFDKVLVKLKQGMNAHVDKAENKGQFIPIDLDIDRVLFGDAQVIVENTLDAKKIDIQIEGIKNKIKDKLTAKNVLIKHPEVFWLGGGVEKNAKESTENEFNGLIEIGNLDIKDANIYKGDESKGEKLETIKNVNFTLTDIEINRETLERQIPVNFKDIKLTTDPFDIDLDGTNRMVSTGLNFENDHIEIKDFEISPKPGRQTDAKAMTIKAPSIVVSDTEWNFEKGKSPFLKASAVNLPSLDLKLAGGGKKSGKKRPGELLPFDLDLKKIEIGKSNFEIRNTITAKNTAVKIDGIKNTNGKKLIVSNVLLSNSDVVLFSGNKKKDGNPSKSGFGDDVLINNIDIKNANYNMMASNGSNALTVSNINLNMKGWQMNSKTARNKIPFDYNSIQLTASGLDNNSSKVYRFKTGNIALNNSNLKVNNFQMKPKMSRAQFVKSLPKEKDFYDISFANMQINNPDFGFNGNDFYFKTPSININNVDANIFRSKIPPDDTSKKKMYSKLLRELKFTLEVKELKINNSLLVYEEETPKSSGAGKITFTNFNANIKNINSGYRKSRLPDVKADIKTDFMNDAKLKVLWTFNPMDRKERFNIKGEINNFDGKKMEPFVKPYLHVSAEGNIQKVSFDFSGDDIKAKGDFGMNYENLKITLYNEKTGKPRKLVSSVGNLLLKKNTNEEFKDKEIKTVERQQDKSFFNFLWLCVQQGLKQVVLVI